MTNNGYNIEVLNAYSEADAAEIGSLMPQLSEHHTGEPIEEETLRDIIDSPDRDQIVARMGGRIVAAATVNLIKTPTGAKLYMDNVVTDEACRGYGIGSAMIAKIKEIGRERKASQIAFTSNPDRTAAHRLYIGHGAVIKDTLSFRIPLD